MDFENAMRLKKLQLQESKSESRRFGLADGEMRFDPLARGVLGSVAKNAQDDVGVEHVELIRCRLDRRAQLKLFFIAEFLKVPAQIIR